MKLLHILTFAAVAAATGPVVAQSTATVQSALTILGYDPGPVDGAWGGKTRAALEAFYADNGGQFSGELGSRDYQQLLLALEPHLETGLTRQDGSTLAVTDHFQSPRTVRFPLQYPFADGTDQPAYDTHQFTVLHPFFHDFDGDGCDDVLVQYMDSYAHPWIIHGRPDDTGEAEFAAVPANHIPKSHSIRNSAVRDIDGDGRPDFVGFTAPHQYDGRSYTPSSEPEIVVLQGGEAFATDREAFAHGGLVADVNGDGNVDIFPIPERSDVPRYILLGDGNGGFEERLRFTGLADDFVFDAVSADLNGDGLDDYVFTTSRDYTREHHVPPARASENGTLVVALGEPGKTINELEFVRMGSHWMDEAHWTAYRLHGISDSFYSIGTDTSYAAPSNVDLLDLDGDGDLDILVGYFVSANSSWHTSGFQLFRNEAGVFTDVTAELAPDQPANRFTAGQPTDAMIGAGMVDLNGDGANDLLLTIQTPDAMHQSQFRASVYLNVDGQFKPVLKGHDSLRQLSFLSTGDFNCDGTADIAGIGPGSRTEGSIRIMLGQAGG